MSIFLNHHFKLLSALAISSLCLILVACSGSKNLSNSVQVDRGKNDRSPLYIVNNTVLTTKEARKKYLRLKPQYLQDVTVLSADEAEDIYGKAGQYRAVKVTLTDSIQVYNDLMTLKKAKNFNTADVEGNIKKVNQPILIGGLANFHRKIKYPKECQKARASGSVIINFKVSRKGQVKNPEVVRGIGWGCDKAALRTLKRSAKFLPALRSGKPVEVIYSLPIRFNLN